MMKAKWRILLLLILVNLTCIHAIAQANKVCQVSEAPFDISARTEKRFDLNGTGCALIKLEAPSVGITFEGNVIGDVKFNINEYWVYMTDGSKRLKVHIPNQPNLLLEFSPLQSLRTYTCVLNIENENQNSVADAVMDYEKRAKAIVLDTTIITNLRKEAYRYLLTTRNISHIMLSLGKTPDEKIKNKNKLDSIRTAIINGESFEEMALKYSIDKTVTKNKGNMGFITSTSFPHPFIEAAYSTGFGAISAVIDDAPYGFHIIKVEDEKPNPGKYLARHIVKVTDKLSDADKIKKRNKIDSIYLKLRNGGDFEEIAKIESEDNGTSTNGGMLPWFGVGQMIPEFEKVIANLENGELSEPFETQFGYHIAQRLDSREINYEEELPTINEAIAKDGRAQEPKKEKLSRLRSLYGIKLNQHGLLQAHKIIEKEGGIDNKTMSILRKDNSIIAKFGLRELTISDVANEMPEYTTKVVLAATDEFDRIANSQLDIFTEEIVRIQLSNHPEVLQHLDD